MQQIAYLVQLGAVKPICDLLVAKDVKIVRVLLDAINNVLKVKIFAQYMCRFLAEHKVVMNYASFLS